MKKVKRKHWYRIYFGGCPVCGRGKDYRERVYGRKPKDYRKRYIQMSERETYDHCMG